tara:strand:- start:1160 stop:1462 length:303 start_codon:yes stop_codon:yes gene_type:complete
MITMGIIMTVSILVNILLIWYITSLLKKFLFITNNVEDLSDSLAGLADHLENVHSLETFYGEPVLQNLLKHTREVVEDIDHYKSIYEVEEVEEQEQEIDE